MKNDFEIRGDVTAIFIKSLKYGNMETLISTCKLEIVSSCSNTWSIRKDNHSDSFYVVCHPPMNNSKTLLLHRVVTNAPKGMEVDHIIHDTLDNTDNNLRILSIAENQQNRKGRSATSSSGVLGVNWHKHSGKWNVQLRINEVKISFGYYKDIKEAELVAIEARKTHMPFSKEHIS